MRPNLGREGKKALTQINEATKYNPVVAATKMTISLSVEFVKISETRIGCPSTSATFSGWYDVGGTAYSLLLVSRQYETVDFA